MRWGEAEDRFLELLKRGTVDDIKEMVDMIAFEKVNVTAVHKVNNVSCCIINGNVGNIYVSPLS